MPSSATALVSHGDIDTSAKETYGTGELILRIGQDMKPLGVEQVD
jgi:hypothetical protein